MSAQEPEELDRLNSEIRPEDESPLSDSASMVSGLVDKAAEEPGVNVPAWFVSIAIRAMKTKSAITLNSVLRQWG